MASRRQPPAAGKESHMYCFVPEADVDIICLASYLKAFIDATATIRPSRHPSDKERLGFTVGASSTLSRDTLEDVISDTKDWQNEQQSREFRDEPYDYRDSDTWQKRRKNGQTPARAPTLVGRERRRVATRHDPNQPATFSEVPSSYASSVPSSVFSRDQGSTYTSMSDDIRPGDSISNAGQNKTANKPPNPRPGGPQPDPDSFRHLSLSDTAKPNQGARVNPPVGGRHAKDPKEDDVRAGVKRPQDRNTGANRKDSLYDYH